MLDERDEKFFSQFDYHISVNDEVRDFLVLVRSHLMAIRDTLIDISAKVENITDEEASKKYQDYADEHFTNLLTSWTDKYGKLRDEDDGQDGKNQ